MPNDRFVQRVAEFYSTRIKEFGETHDGVDWPSVDRQEIRFVQFERLLPKGESFRLLDLGCGYGALYDWLLARGFRPDYRGIDVSEEMIAHAKRRHEGDPRCRFETGDHPSAPADYVCASGIFNVKLDAPLDQWHRHVVVTVEAMSDTCTRGFAFNMLTSYREPHRKMDHLYYGDPIFWLDECLRKYGPDVALLHDYELWDFTIIVRKVLD
jgi:SAM-dependent methyltransferase